MLTDGPVVIAIDGSSHSVQTLRWGLDEAARREADVLLVRVYREPRELVEWSWYPLLGEDLGLDTEAKEYLAAQLVGAQASHPGLTIDTRLLCGAEVSELRRVSEQAQLMVIGTTGLAGHARLGSVSGHLAAHARCPVVLVRQDGEHATTPVAVGVDGSPASLAAARTAAREAALREVPLVVVHARATVADPHGRGIPALPPMADGTIDETDPTHRAARDVVDLLRSESPGLDVRLELVDDDPVHALVVAAHDAQLLVLGSRGLGAFRGMLLGAVSNEVVRDAPTTVLVMHDGEPH